MSKQWIGIDISKDNLSIAFQAESGWQEQEIENTATAIGNWARKLDGSTVHVVLEFTGTYGHKLMWLLRQCGIAYSAITPRQSRQFAGVLKSITKNDARDARLLALFGQQVQPPPHELPSEAVERLQQLRTVLRQLKKQQRMLLNQQHALGQRLHVDALAKQVLEQAAAQVGGHIERLEREISTLADDEFSDLLQRVTSVKGIGKAIATALLTATNGLKAFSSHKELAKFIGIAPTQFHSGTSVRGKGHINRSGDAHLRSLLYAGTWSALRGNKACRALYDRLRSKGKPAKVALIAVAHKLLRQIWAVVKHNTLFDNDFEFKEQLA
jgi:transposase